MTRVGMKDSQQQEGKVVIIEMTMCESIMVLMVV